LKGMARVSKKNKIFPRSSFCRFYSEFHLLPSLGLNDEEYGEYIHAVFNYCVEGVKPDEFRSPKAETFFVSVLPLLSRTEATDKQSRDQLMRGCYYLFYDGMFTIFSCIGNDFETYGCWVRRLNEYALYGKEPELNDEGDMTFWTSLKKFMVKGG